MVGNQVIRSRFSIEHFSIKSKRQINRGKSISVIITNLNTFRLSCLNTSKEYFELFNGETTLGALNPSINGLRRRLTDKIACWHQNHIGVVLSILKRFVIFNYKNSGILRTK